MLMHIIVHVPCDLSGAKMHLSFFRALVLDNDSTMINCCLSLILLLLSLVNQSHFCAEIKTFYPNFALNSNDLSSPKFAEDKELVCSTRACQRRFRAYSEIDFEERDQYRFKLEGVRFGSFYEYLRDVAIRGDFNQILRFSDALQQGLFNFPVIKHWLMLDKLMRDPLVHQFEELMEYLYMVLEMKSENNEQTLELYKIKLATLKSAIRTHKPLNIVKALLEHLKPELKQQPKDIEAILNYICATFYSQVTVKTVPDVFYVLPMALEELDSVSTSNWLQSLYEEDLSDHVPLTLLVPFYLLLSDSQKHESAMKSVLESCVFDFNRENMEIISKFIESTNFCTFDKHDSTIYQQRKCIFDFILEKFEVNAKNLEDHFTSAIERNCLGLMEAFLIFYPASLLFNHDMVSHSIFEALFAKHLEAALLIATYSEITADFLTATWNSYPDRVRSRFDASQVRLVKSLLAIANEFDADFSEYPEIIQNDGTILHTLVEPSGYERLAQFHTSRIAQVFTCNYYIARLILARYFGVAFTASRVLYDPTCIPSWPDVAGVINFFLDLHHTKHRVNIPISESIESLIK